MPPVQPPQVHPAPSNQPQPSASLSPETPQVPVVEVSATVVRPRPQPSTPVPPVTPPIIDATATTVSAPQTSVSAVPVSQASRSEAPSTTNQPPAIPTTQPAAPPSDHLKFQGQWLKVLTRTFRGLILGGARKGKTALAHFLLEALQCLGPIYILSFPADKINLLPVWVNVITSLNDLPPGAICVADESYIEFSARSSMDEKNKELARIMGLCKQRGCSILFISQNSGLVDRTIISMVDIIIFKQPDLLQEQFERPELKPLIAKVKTAFQSVTGDPKRFAYVLSAAFEGMLENDTAEYWCQEISTAYSGACIPGAKEGKPLTKEEKKAKAKELYPKLRSYNKVAEKMGVTKGTIINWVKHNR